MPTRRVREIFDGRQALIPELPCAGFDHFGNAGQLPPHRHDEAFELCLIVSGSVDWWVGKDVHEVRGGDLFLTRPAEVHGGEHAVMNPCELFWFHIRLRPREPAAGHSAAQTAVLRSRLRSLALRSFPSSATTRSLCQSLFAEHRRRDVLAGAAARVTLGSLLIWVLRDHDAAVHARRRYSPAVAAAIAFIRSHREEPFRITDVAAAVGCNVAHLHKLFAAETGISPGRWRLRTAISSAKAMLREGAGVLEVAMALQFSSSQYFATAFRRVAGLTPQQYRKAAGGGKNPQKDRSLGHLPLEYPATTPQEPE